MIQIYKNASGTSYLHYNGVVYFELPGGKLQKSSLDHSMMCKAIESGVLVYHDRFSASAYRMLKFAISFGLIANSTNC